MARQIDNTKEKKSVPFWLEIVALVVAVIGGIIGWVGGIIGIVQSLTPKGPTEVAIIAQPPSIQAISYDKGAALQVSIGDFVLDGTQAYCVTATTNISVVWTASQSCRSITYQLGEKDPVTVKNSNEVSFRFSTQWNRGETSLKVSAEGFDGERTEEQVYRFIIFVPDADSEDLFTVCSNGASLHPDNTYLLSKGQPLYIINNGSQEITELYYKIGTGEIVNVDFSGYYEVIPADSFADTGAFSFQICGRLADGVQTPWVLYVLQTTAEKPA